MAEDTTTLVTLDNLSEHTDEIKRILQQVRAYIDKQDNAKVDKVSGKGLSTNDLTTELLNKLNSLENYDDTAVRNLIKGISSRIDTLVGESATEAIDNFNEILAFLNGVSDTQTLQGLLSNLKAEFDGLLANKVDKVSGKQLSTNDYTTAEKTKLSGIETGAQKNTITGVKGNAESSYRTGNVNLTPADIGAAKASHTHTVSQITDFTTSVKTLQAADILSSEPTETTLTHTVNGTEVAYQIGELVRVPDSSSETGYKFYQLHNITDGKAIWAAVGTGSGGGESNILISTIYIDQTITDPASMISGDINGAAIQAIRANSHRCLGKYTAENTMTICQLLDANSKLFHDGTVADLTGTQGDVWMLLPYFYTKATELAEDIWKIQFAYGGKPDGDGWKQWGGNDLIGVYEGYVTDSKLYSRSGVLPSASISQANFKTYARNRGTGFTLVKHKHQNIMAFLFYALYGNTNAQAICGSGTPDYHKTTGKTNSLGMNDTTASNGNSMSINYFGLENWWGNFYEWEDNIIVNSNVWNITEDDGTTRQVAGFNGADIFFPTKLIIGEYLDTIMKPGSTTGSTSIGYCDGQYLSSDNNRVARRSFDSNDEKGGLIFVSIQFDAYNTYDNRSSRLAFNGTIIEQKDVSTFKSLTAIG